MGWKTITAAWAIGLASAPGHAASWLGDVSIYDRTQRAALPVYVADGTRYVAGQPGHEYALRVTNRSSVDLLAVVSVDGVNVLTGQTAAAAQSGYVIPAGGSVEIKGWRKSLERVAAFYFTDLGNSYAARTGRPDNVGVIGVALFKRKVRLESWQPGTALDDASGARSESGRGRRAEEKAAAPAGSAADQARAAPAPVPAPALGTGHGRSEASAARYVEFERESPYPDEVITLRYDSDENLAALGVIPVPPRLARRPGPDPFPAGFVPDPPAR